MASVSNEDLIEHIYDASLSPKAWPAKPEVVLSAKLNLSPAEVRVGPALLEGMTPAEAVQVLGLSIHTVKLIWLGCLLKPKRVGRQNL